MSVKELNQDEALAAGVKLWILPSTQFSDWTKQLDWPLNLQISKAAAHPVPKLSADLMTILQKHDMDFSYEEPEKKNLVIATQGLLPTDMIVIVTGETWESWSKSAVKVWQDLGKPTARFFLPGFARWEKVKSSWPASANLESVQIVSTEGVA